MPEETSRHLLLGVKDQRLGAEEDQLLVDPKETLSATVKRQKLSWFGYVTRHDILFKTILQGTLEGGQHCGWQRKCLMDNVKEWTSLPMLELLTRASCRKDWMGVFAELTVMSL